MPRVTKYSDFPSVYTCNLCGETKPIDQMIVQFHSKEKIYRMRPRCKDCHNARERGYRREYKTNYLRQWRKRNKKINESYWKENPDLKEKQRIRHLQYFYDNHEEILIQGRMRRKGLPVSLAEAKELLKNFGRCYPSRIGLSKAGLKRCEQIRSRLRNRNAKKIDVFQIRLMVYDESLEDKSLIIRPNKQPIPYKSASLKLKKWNAEKRLEEKNSAD